MPLYEYRCTKCGHRFEKIQSFHAQPEAVCPQCGGELERPLTAPAFQFKGSGWYVNDYASKGSSSTSTSSSTSSADSKPAESKPTESAPAAAESKPAASTPSASNTSSAG